MQSHPGRVIFFDFCFIYPTPNLFFKIKMGQEKRLKGNNYTISFPHTYQLRQSIISLKKKARLSAQHYTITAFLALWNWLVLFTIMQEGLKQKWIIQYFFEKITLKEKATKITVTCFAFQNFNFLFAMKVW